jgi:hypothetical protein
MIIGAQKSGTTSLANQLAQHPQVCFASNKEPAYFNRTPRWRDGLDAYHALFAPLPGQICGEASTMYTFQPEWLDTHARLHEYNPELKLVYIMRHPVERIVSHYAFRQVRDRVRLSADEAVLADPAYVNRSRYGVQLRPYIELFGRERIALLVFEEYIKDPRCALRDLAEFLGIEDAPFDHVSVEARGATAGTEVLGDRMRQVRRVLKRAGMRTLIPKPVAALVKKRFSRSLETKPVLSAATRDVLWRMLEDDVRDVERLLGRTISAWR